MYPRITTIEEKKKELVSSYQSLQKIRKQGLSFWEFKAGANSKQLDSYTRNILSNIDENFFSENFTNTGSQDYIPYLWEVEAAVQEVKSSPEFLQKEEYLNNLLPTYDQDGSFSWEGLSDFHFINSVENLLYSFNLSYLWEIWIWELIDVNESDDSKSQSSSTVWDKPEQSLLQENIFKIPLGLTIVWQKTDVVDFIHYFENVSRISISGEEFKVANDGFIKKRIEGSKPSTSYNIYENQLADISTVVIRDYPDSSSLETQWLLSAMKGDQAKEKIEVDLEIFFYVAWVPGYKMQTFVQDFISEQKILSAKVKQDAQKYTLQKYKYSWESEKLIAIQKIQSLSIVMLTLDDEVKMVTPKLAKIEDIGELYYEVVWFAQQLDKLEGYFNEQLAIITEDKSQ